MAKKVAGIVKLQLNAGQANPAPPVGPALGHYGVNIMEFCKQYNEKTKDKAGTIVPVEITIFADRTFTFITKTPPASELIRKALGIPKGSSEPSKTVVATMKRAQLKQIAETKLPDLNANDVEGAMKIIEGTARSMGVQIED